MEKTQLPTGFRGFHWALACFCMPILLWPLALLISPNLLKNTQLTDAQSTFMSIFLWSYPLFIAIVARILFKLELRFSALAKKLLVVCTFMFYVLVIYIVKVGFNY